MASVQETVLIVGKRNEKKVRKAPAVTEKTKKPRASPTHPPYSEVTGEGLLIL